MRGEPLSRIQGVIFDLDGTLIDSLGVWGLVDELFLGKRRIPVPEKLGDSIEGMSLPEAALYFKEHFRLAESIEMITSEWTDMAEKEYREKVQPLPGADDLLRRLRAKKLSISLGSSNCRTLAGPLLERLGWVRFFDHVLYSSEVAEGKTSPILFQELSRKMGIDPESIVVIEDGKAGLLAARSAGMLTIAVERRQFNHAWEEIQRLGDISVESLSELIPLSTWLTCS